MLMFAVEIGLILKILLMNFLKDETEYQRKVAEERRKNKKRLREKRRREGQKKEGTPLFENQMKLIIHYFFTW